MIYASTFGREINDGPILHAVWTLLLDRSWGVRVYCRDGTPASLRQRVTICELTRSLAAVARTCSPRA